VIQLQHSQQQRDTEVFKNGFLENFLIGPFTVVSNVSDQHSDFLSFRVLHTPCSDNRTTN
jgi:hypothetical protein